jgi:hypothetical protein
MPVTPGLTSVFLGLCPKFRRARPHDWCVRPETEHVVEICSVSHCIAYGPPLAIDSADLCNSPLYWATERGVCEWLLPESEWAFPGEEAPAGPLYLYAFRAVPLEFRGRGTPRHLEPQHFFAGDYSIPLLEPDLSGYQRLGYDVVEFRPCRLLDLEVHDRAENSRLCPGAGHSPLSCNGLACNYPVNPFCLLDEMDLALRVARAFGEEQPEPGSYVIVEVLRRCLESDPARS